MSRSDYASHGDASGVGPKEEATGVPAIKTVATVLAERGPVHGSFYDNAGIAQGIKQFMRQTPNWAKLTLVQQEALDVIALKVSRILSEGSDPNHMDHWVDIAGYATLATRKWT